MGGNSGFITVELLVSRMMKYSTFPQYELLSVIIIQWKYRRKRSFDRSHFPDWAVMRLVVRIAEWLSLAAPHC